MSLESWLFSNFDDVDDSPSGNKDTHAAHLKQCQTKQPLTVSRDGCRRSHQYSGLSIRDWERTRANISSLIFFFFKSQVKTMDI